MRTAIIGVVWSAWLSAACGRIGFASLADGDPEVDAPPPPADASVDIARYRATAVRFDSSAEDYMWTGSLLDTANSPRGTFSAWLRFHAGDGETQLIAAAQIVGIGGVIRTSSNHLRFLMQNCVGVAMLDVQTEGTYTTASGWLHVLAAWDLSAGRADLYVNGVRDRAPGLTLINGSVCYDSLKWGIGGLASGQLDADVADLYASLDTYIDLGVEANRRRFSTGSGRPVDLGVACSAPTGSPASGCFVGDAASWNVNKGTAAGFTVVGDGLAPAPTSPSD